MDAFHDSLERTRLSRAHNLGRQAEPGDAGSGFRTSDCQYVYNLAASSLSAGRYRIEIAIDGITVGDAEFSLR